MIQNKTKWNETKWDEMKWQNITWKKNWLYSVLNLWSMAYKSIVLTTTPPGTSISKYDKTIIHSIYTRVDSALGW